MIAIVVFGLPCMLALCVLALCMPAFCSPALCVPVFRMPALCLPAFCAFSFRVLAFCVLALCMRSLRYLRFACRRLRLFKTGLECGIVGPNVCGKRPKEVLSRKKCLVKTLCYFNMKKLPVILTTFEARFEQN